MRDIYDLRSEIRWLASGFLLTFFSGYGQTHTLAVFAGYLKSDLSVSDGEFGAYYTIGTLASAALLSWSGKFADRFSIRWLGAGVLLALAAMSLFMSSVGVAWMLVLAFFGLRFFGQGMATHVAMTAMARWFNRKRGRAISIAALGLPASAAVMPWAAVVCSEAFGWRTTWLIAAAIIVAFVFVLLLLLQHERVPTRTPAASDAPQPQPIRRQWTRGEVLRSPLFYALLPGVMAPAFIGTGIFFNQVGIVEAKGWELAWFAANLPILAGVTVLSSLAVGWLVDRFGARRMLAFYLFPLGLGALTLVYGATPAILPLFMTLMALTSGGDAVVQNALWAELYGTAHVGAIRAVAAAGLVFASALSPGLTGLLLEAVIAPETQLFAGAIYCFAAALWMGVLASRIARQAES